MITCCHWEYSIQKYGWRARTEPKEDLICYVCESDKRIPKKKTNKCIVVGCIKRTRVYEKCWSCRQEEAYKGLQMCANDCGNKKEYGSRFCSIKCHHLSRERDRLQVKLD